MIFKFFFFCVTALVLSANELITPIPLNPTYDLAKAQLGKIIFSDTRLSKNNTHSLNTCHPLNAGGSDGQPYSKNIQGIKPLNAPTVFNAIYNFKNFWDGRANNLEEQVRDSLLNTQFMNNSKRALVEHIASTYQEDFKRIYAQGVSFNAIVEVLVEFQKALTTPNAPFDRYLRGDKDALTYSEKKGYEVFKSSGCIACHNGVNLGGNAYSKIEVLPEETSPYLGRYNITKNPKDKYFIKIPMLRNILSTAPYFHDGSVATIDEAIQGVSRHALKRKLTSSEIEYLIQFLNTLSGEKPAILTKSTSR